MRHFVLSLALGLFLFLGFSASAQERLELSYDNPTQIIGNKQYKLIEVDNWGDVKIEYIELDQEGRVYQKGIYVNGKHHGVWTMYRNGEISGQMKFSNGQKVWCKVYNEEGYTLVYYQDNRPHVIQTEQRLASN